MAIAELPAIAEMLSPDKAGSGISSDMAMLAGPLSREISRLTPEASAGAGGLANSAKQTTTVIGRVKDLQNLGQGEQSLLSRLPNRGSPQANWRQDKRGRSNYSFEANNYSAPFCLNMAALIIEFLIFITIKDQRARTQFRQCSVAINLVLGWGYFTRIRAMIRSVV